MRGRSLSSRVHLLPEIQEGRGSSSGESWKRVQKEDSSSERPERGLPSSVLSVEEGVLEKECCVGVGKGEGVQDQWSFITCILLPGERTSDLLLTICSAVRDCLCSSSASVGRDAHS